MSVFKAPRESLAAEAQAQGFRFVCEAELREGDVGKLILTKIKNEKVVRLCLAVAEGVSIPPRPAMDDRYVLDSLKAEAPSIDRSAGSHSDIKHQGWILGGASYAVIGGTLFVDGLSGNHQSADRECIELCIEGKGLRLVTGQDVLEIPWRTFVNARER